jgi:hypothetical protein
MDRRELLKMIALATVLLLSAENFFSQVAKIQKQVLLWNFQKMI